MRSSALLVFAKITTPVAVKSVSHTEEHVARLLISLLDESFQSLAERFITRLIALHNLMASLADHNEMIVFVYYLHY